MTVQDQDQQHDRADHGCCETEDDTGTRVTRRRFLGFASLATFVPVSVRSAVRRRVPEKVRRKIVWVGSISDVRERLAGEHMIYVPEARAYLLAITAAEQATVASSLAKDELVGVNSGFLAVGQRCPHLGCKIPFCESSGWFECPCHGSQFAPTSDKRGGPAPRGMSRHTVIIQSGKVGIDRVATHAGFGPKFRVSSATPSGPHCVGHA